MSRKVINVVVNGGGGDNSVEYLAGPFEDNVYTTLQMLSYLTKIRRNNKIAIGGLLLAYEATKDNTLAFAITPNAKIVDADE